MRFLFVLPLSEPVYVLAILFSIVLISPLLLKKLKIPSIVGLIVMGVIIGPKGFNILGLEGGIKLLSSLGLVYLMFIAGLEIDLRHFKTQAYKSVTYGSLTFFVPLIIGTFSSIFVLHFTFTEALLLASMYATHTLISYPIVSRLGITKTEVVTITVGGTILTDTAALVLLSFITAWYKGGTWYMIALETIITLALFFVFIWYIMPVVARWFFKRVTSQTDGQFMFVLAFVFVIASVAHLSGLEPIIGAFLAGLLLNRLIPHASVLMNRINFVGNALFIPVFLFSVGMRVDPRILFSDYSAWKIAVTILITAYATKWLAAFVTQKLFNYSSIERRIIFGLGSSHAAATLAIVLIGFDLKIFDVAVLNGTILMILVSCVLSTFITENAGKKLALKYDAERVSDMDATERILIPVSNPATFSQLIDLALLLKNPQSNEPLYPLTIVSDDENSRHTILLNNSKFNEAVKHAKAADVEVSVATRVDGNIASGITRAVKDLAISYVIIGWNGKPSMVDDFFGSIMSQLLMAQSQMVLVSKIVDNWSLQSKESVENEKEIVKSEKLKVVSTQKRSTINAQLPTNLRVFFPTSSTREIGFKKWLNIAFRLEKQLNATISFYEISDDLEMQLGQHPLLSDLSDRITHFNSWMDVELLELEIKSNELLIFVSAREQSDSYDKSLARLPRLLAEKFTRHSFLLIFPEIGKSV